MDTAHLPHFAKRCDGKHLGSTLSSLTDGVDVTREPSTSPSGSQRRVKLKGECRDEVIPQQKKAACQARSGRPLIGEDLRCPSSPSVSAFPDQKVKHQSFPAGSGVASSRSVTRERANADECASGLQPKAGTHTTMYAHPKRRGCPL